MHTLYSVIRLSRYLLRFLIHYVMQLNYISLPRQIRMPKGTQSQSTALFKFHIIRKQREKIFKSKRSRNSYQIAYNIFIDQMSKILVH